MREPALLSWSGGKDSCLALHALQRSGHYQVAGLLTTIGRDDDQVAIHGVPRALILAQAAALGLPVDFVALPPAADNRTYEQAVAAALDRPHLAGISTVAFGDLFLSDIRDYREQMMARLRRRPIFPLWGRDTRALLDDFIAAGFLSVIVSVDLARLDSSFAGRRIDHDLAAALPPGVDPCGEAGEYHSFVFDGPIFSAPVPFRTAGKREQDGLSYCEIAPVDA